MRYIQWRDMGVTVQVEKGFPTGLSSIFVSFQSGTKPSGWRPSDAANAVATKYADELLTEVKSRGWPRIQRHKEWLHFYEPVRYGRGSRDDGIIWEFRCVKERTDEVLAMLEQIVRDDWTETAALSL